MLQPLVEFFRFFVGPLRRFLPAQIVFLAIDEHDDVGILLDRPRFAKIGELRPLVLAVLHGAGKLGEREHRNVELLRQRLEAARDLGNLLDPALVARVPRARDELQVIDHQQGQPVLALEAARAGPESRDGQRGRVVDIEGQPFEFPAGPHELFELGLVQLAAANLVGGDLRLFGDHTVRQLLGRHLQRIEADDRGALAPILGLGVDRAGDVEGDVGGQRRLAHGRAPRQHDQVGFVQPAQHQIDLGEAARHADRLAVALERGLGHVDGFGDRVLQGPETAFVAARGREVVEALFGGLDLVDGGHLQIARKGVVDDVGPKLDQLAPQMEVVDQPPVVGGVDDRRRVGGKPRDIGRAADRAVHLVGLEEIPERGRIGFLAPFDQRLARAVYAAVELFAEMLGREKFRDPFERPVVDQDRAEQPHLRLDVRRRAAMLLAFGLDDGNGFGHTPPPRQGMDGNRARSESVASSAPPRSFVGGEIYPHGPNRGDSAPRRQPVKAGRGGAACGWSQAAISSRRSSAAAIRARSQSVM